MHRIDTPSAQKDKFGEGKNGFTKSDPQMGTPATQLDYLYCDAIQEEIANAIESAGIKLNKSKHNQLALAIKELINKSKVKLSSAINSTSETEAATPKAIKAAYDLANEKLSLAGGKLTGDLIIEKINASIQLSTSGTNYVLSTSENGEACSFYFPDANNSYTQRLVYTKQDKTFNFKDCNVKVDNSEVITTETISNYVPMTIVLYPNGSEASPPTIKANQRIVIDNPFKTMNVSLKIELLAKGEWGSIRNGVDDQGTNRFTGIGVNTLGDSLIVVQVGREGFLWTGVATGNPFASIASPVQYRVRVTKLGN